MPSWIPSGLRPLIASAVLAGLVMTPAIVVILLGGEFADALFMVFALIVLISGLAVVLMRDIIRCGLAMIVCFGALAGIYVIAGATLVAAAQVLIYIGAISVLVLFAIMLTQTKAAPSRLVFQTQAVPAAISTVVLAFIIGVTITTTAWDAVGERMHTATDVLGRLLFDQYILPFQIVAVLILAAVVGGVFLAKREPGGPS
jgi:NADH:ubiquinone oxidoreductase subunit 6 (subunit J)